MPIAPHRDALAMPVGIGTGETLGLPDDVRVRGFGGSRRIADASAMRLDVIPSFGGHMRAL
eukprot:4462180-Pyramimonas_sp.AAC.1